jgi:hypothetical protein
LCHNISNKNPLKVLGLKGVGIYQQIRAAVAGDSERWDAPSTAAFRMKTISSA